MRPGHCTVGGVPMLFVADGFIENRKIVTICTQDTNAKV